jgi:hypothetical protein
MSRPRCITVYATNTQELASHNFDEVPFFLFEGEIVDTGFDAIPPSDYILPVKFPNCCKNHPKILAHLMEWFSRFPSCCEWHEELSNKIWFRKEDFGGLPLKILKNLFFTVQHISTKANKTNWEKEITDYIEYNLASFGSPALGSDWYLRYLKAYVKQTKPPLLSKEKRLKVLEFIAEQTDSTVLEPVDLNLLYTTFQRWVQALPNLDIFSNFKRKYAGKIPSDFLFYSAEYNPYLNQTKLRPRTRKQLLKLLVSYTKDALGKVDSALLLKDGVISDITKHQFDLAGGKRKFNQDKLLGRYSKGELKYVDVMRQWLLNEEEYFASISPLLENSNILPHLPRTGKPVAPSTHIENHLTFGPNGSAQMAQGDNTIQTNVFSDNAQIETTITPPPV